MILRKRLSDLCGTACGILLLACATTALAVDVTVETFDQTLNGTLIEIQPQRIELVAEGQTISVSVNEIIDVQVDQAKSSNQQPVSGLALLKDGSVIPHSAWEYRDEAIHFVSRVGTIQAVPIIVRQDEITSWRLPGDPPLADADWSAIETLPASDVLIVPTRDGSLRSVEGVIEQLDANGVRFLLDGESIEVQWKRIAGLIFYREPATATNAIRVDGFGGMKIVAQQIVTKSDWVQITTTSGSLVQLPLSSIQAIDYSAGKAFEASALEVVAAEWKPYFGRGWSLKESTTYASDSVGQPQRNAAFGGGPLKLLFADGRVPGLGVTKSFESGWALRSRSELTLRLPDNARWLKGWIGLDPESNTSGSAVVAIQADGQVLWDSEVNGKTPPIELRLAIDGFKQITLLVDYGENLDTGDSIHFADLKVLR